MDIAERVDEMMTDLMDTVHVALTEDHDMATAPSAQVASPSTTNKETAAEQVAAEQGALRKLIFEIQADQTLSALDRARKIQVRLLEPERILIIIVVTVVLVSILVLLFIVLSSPFPFPSSSL